MLTAADQRLLIMPVLAALAAMAALAVVAAWWQLRRQRATITVRLAPRAIHEPRSHVLPATPHDRDTTTAVVYDWSAADRGATQ